MEIRPYSPGDETAIRALFQAVFRKEMTEAYWNWRYRDNPAAGPMIDLMWDSAELVGHYAVSPVGLQVNGTAVLAALSMTTMTHPAYNGRGIFTTLAENLYARIHRAQGVAAVFGFPNDQSHRGFVKNLAWQDLSALPTFSLKVRPDRVPAADPRVRLLPATEPFTDAHTAAARQALDRYAVAVDRTPAYLTWRYRLNPEATYETFEWTAAGEPTYYVVTKRFNSFDTPGRQEVDILDLAVPNEPALIAAFVGALLAHYAAHEPIRLNLWLPLHDPRHLELEKLGFTHIAPITYAGVRSFDSTLAPTLLSDRAWAFGFGDSDVY